MEVVRRGFMQGQIHPDDIDAMVKLLRRFGGVSYIARAIEYWASADKLLDEFRLKAGEYRDLIRSECRVIGGGPIRAQAPGRNQSRADADRSRFFGCVGAGVPLARELIISVLFLAVLTVESIGLTLTYRATRALSRGLAEAHERGPPSVAGTSVRRCPCARRTSLGNSRGDQSNGGSARALLPRTQSRVATGPRTRSDGAGKCASSTKNPRTPCRCETSFSRSPPTSSRRL